MLRILIIDESRARAAELCAGLIEGDRLVGAMLCNETRATDWLLDLIARGEEFGGSTAEFGSGARPHCLQLLRCV